MLIKGIGTPPNPKLAIEIIKENPEEDSAEPLLYYCCKYGAGCEKDAVKAGEYMNRIKADYSAKICAMEIFGGESNIWYPFTLDIPYEKILFLLPDHIHLADVERKAHKRTTCPGYFRERTAVRQRQARFNRLRSGLLRQRRIQ